MDDLPARHTIEIFQVRQTLRGALARGLDAERILRRAGIPTALLQSAHARVTLHQYATLLGVLRCVMRDEFWGLCSRPVPIGSFAYCCRAALRTSNLRDAITVAFGLYRLVLSDFSPHLRVTDGVAHIALPTRVAVPDDALRYALRSFTFLGFGLMSWLVARRIELGCVRFIDDPSRSGVDVARMFQAPLQYEADVAGFSFDARWLDLPIIPTPQSLEDFLRQAPANLLVNYRDQARTCDQTRTMLRARLDTQLPSLEQVAREFGISPQTLNRRLVREGNSFQALKNELRRDAAIDFLTRTDMTLTEIANHLGFSEASTFHRSFKSWTGVAPGEYRRTAFDLGSDSPLRRFTG
ncbi:MAG: hypothetical protein A2710_23675 [Burkholderiales bacterium RIFCSPHIGHO2_01_FULL_64_960]|nr:MAG: hypothetical protein A2710_23675 [Burkholderiales bacterium RIFCSPHIGHO2_01_FULL_64_960]